MTAAITVGDFRRSLANLWRLTAAAYEEIADKSQSGNDAAAEAGLPAGQPLSPAINQVSDTGANRRAAAAGRDPRWPTDIESSISTTYRRQPSSSGSIVQRTLCSIAIIRGKSAGTRSARTTPACCPRRARSLSASYSAVEISGVSDPALRAAVKRFRSRAPSDIAASIS